MRLALLALLAVALTGCALLTHPIEKPTAQVRGVAVGSVSFTGLDGTIDLDIQNPNSFGVPLSEIEWQLSVGNARAVSGRISLSQEIPARGTAPVHAALRIAATDAIAVGGEVAGGVRSYTLSARLHFSTKLGKVSVDVANTGTLTSL